MCHFLSQNGLENAYYFSSLFRKKGYGMPPSGKSLFWQKVTIVERKKNEKIST